MKTLLRIARYLSTALLLELTFIMINYFTNFSGTNKFTYLLNPVEAIYNSIAYLNEELNWSFFISYLTIMVLFTIIIILYFFLMSRIFQKSDKGEIN